MLFVINDDSSLLYVLNIELEYDVVANSYNKLVNKFKLDAKWLDNKQSAILTLQHLKLSHISSSSQLLWLQSQCSV